MLNMNIESLLNQALKVYDLEPDSVFFEKTLPGFYHNDYHFKIRVQGNCYSARFIGTNRYSHDVFTELTDQVLAEQMKYIDFLNNNEVPFMRLIKTSNSEEYTKISWGGTEYTFLLFDWMDGQHITHCTESVSYRFGKMARKIHDISKDYKANLPRKSHIVGSKKFISILQNEARKHSMEVQSLLQNYIHLANEHVKMAYSTNHDEFIMQSDLNPLNVLWNDEENIIGIVDFEHIGYTDRIEGLAWLIKWYSRPNGIQSHDVSIKLTESFLLGYGAHDFIGNEERVRLSSLLWLTGSLNWGFVNKTMKVLKMEDLNLLEQHLDRFRSRGTNLSSLISTKKR